MQTYVISLERTPKRLETFRKLNPQLTNCQVFKAVDGQTLDVEDLVRRGIATNEVKYTLGAYGCALSHFALWEQCIKLNAPITVCEDDARMHPDFERFRELALKKLPPHWDYILWGWNFDSVLEAGFLPGLSPTAMVFKQDAMRARLDAYLGKPIKPAFYKLHKAFGTPCYSVTPAGARKLLAHCKPIRKMAIAFPILKGKVSNFGWDLMANGLYSNMNSWVCFPPLALTPNEHSTSTVQTQLQRPSNQGIDNRESTPT